MDVYRPVVSVVVSNMASRCFAGLPLIYHFRQRGYLPPAISPAISVRPAVPCPLELPSLNWPLIRRRR